MDVLNYCVQFGHALRDAGVSKRNLNDFVSGLTKVQITKKRDVYWVGRATLCATAADIPIYDVVFEDWFGNWAAQSTERELINATTLSINTDEPPSEESTEPEKTLHVASSQEVLRSRDVAMLDDDERERLSWLFNALTVTLPLRKSRRHEARHRGRIDVRATVRNQLRNGGELEKLEFSRPKYKTRGIVLLVDVSRSMNLYADQFLRLSHQILGAEPHAVNVFTMGTRLTRVNEELLAADSELALQTAGNVIPDWAGGTRIAESLNSFTNRWGNSRVTRQSVIVIMSDGWERGDVEPLSKEMSRLSLLAHSIIWVNPHRSKSGYEPIQSGIKAVLPYIDHFLGGHTFDTFVELLEVIRNV